MLARNPLTLNTLYHMYFLIFGYVLTVAFACYFVSIYKNESTRLGYRLSNHKTWLDEANCVVINLEEELKVAYKTIDRLQDKIDGEVIPDNVNDKVASAGMYYDGEGDFTLDKMSWSTQKVVTYSESDESDV